MQNIICLVLLFYFSVKSFAQTKADSTLKAQIIEPTDFDKLLTKNILVVADFHADWCGPCQKMLPTFAQLKAEYQGKALFIKINYDLSKRLAQRYGIDEIPTMLVFKKNKMVNRLIGYMDANTMRALLKDSFDKPVD